MNAEREMLEAAARAIGITITWDHGQEFPERVELFRGHFENYEPWSPRLYSSDAFELAAALRISVEHNHAEETRPWVCATIDGGPLRMKKAFVEDVPDESQRADRMRLAILRCAAAQAPAVAMETAENGAKTAGNGVDAGSRRGGGA